MIIRTLIFLQLVATIVLWLGRSSDIHNSTLGLVLFLANLVGLIWIERQHEWTIVRFQAALESNIRILSDLTLPLADSSAVAALRCSNMAVAVLHSAEAVEEILNQSRNNSTVASRAVSTNLSVSDHVQSGKTEIKTLSEVMHNTSQSAFQIRTITEQLDDIALQTNILALNAAVEASHAGDHGKGFAVVADAVRDLAQKSAAASKQISNLIQVTCEQMETASSKTASAVEVFEQIFKSTNVISDLIKQVSAASQDQESGTVQIARAMQSLEVDAQETKTISSNLSKTASKLSKQSEIMQILSTELLKKTIGSKSKDPRLGLSALKKHLWNRGEPVVVDSAKGTSTIKFGTYDPGADFSILDSLKSNTGGVCTVFLKSKLSGEFVRISTNILDADGFRAIGTTMSNGPALNSLKQGKTFVGRVRINNHFYDTCYEPIFIGAETAGAIYFGYLVE